MNKIKYIAGYIVGYLKAKKIYLNLNYWRGRWDA